MARSTVPPEAVQRACKRGLDLYEEGLGGDGLEAATIKEARSMAAGEAQTEAKIRKGNRWWGRNERFLDEPKDSSAYVAALLWGGASGRDWFRSMYDSITKEEKSDTMKIETRYVRQFNLRMEGAEGTEAGLKGVALAYGQMDTYNTVFAPRSAEGTLQDFVANGSLLASHDADDLAIGYIRSAVETPVGVEVEVVYHSTDEAMAARTVAIERLAAGKKVGLSIGFRVAGYVEFMSGDMLLEGAAAMGYDLAQFNTEAIRKCTRSCYLITRLEKILEVSQVNFPSVPESEASAVRKTVSGTPVGVSLADQITTALGAVEMVTERATDVLALRSSNDKTLGKTTLERLYEVREALDALISKAEQPTAYERQQEKLKLAEGLI